MKFLRLKYFIYTSDWKSLIIVSTFSIVLLFIGLSHHFFPGIWHESKSKFDSQTTGELISVQDIDFYSRDFDGAKIVRVGYEIEYRFKVGDNIFFNKKMFPSTFFFTRMKRDFETGRKKIHIHYTAKNPNVNTIAAKKLKLFK